jgi:small neutral amino acid transporter SnatA (MarC family)
MKIDLPFLHLIFVGFLALFPAVNPVGSAFIVEQIVNRLSAFLVFCIGMQFASAGIRSIIKG